MKTIVLLSFLASSTLSYSIPTSTTPPSNATDIKSRSMPMDITMGITVYADRDCKGNGHIFDDIKYGKNNEIVRGNQGNLYGARSYHLSRGLLPGEQLDWSRPGTPHDLASHNCANYYQSTAGEQPEGCNNFDVKVSCFNLWSHPGH